MFKTLKRLILGRPLETRVWEKGEGPKFPMTWPRRLIPVAVVKGAPGTSRVVKWSSLKRKPRFAGRGAVGEVLIFVAFFA